MTKNELYSYFVSPTVYIFTIIFLILMGYFTFMMGEFFEVGEANLQQFFLWQPWLYLLLVPAIGMGMWSEERKTGTIELLFTMPVTMSECIISKFLAAWIVLGVAISLTFPIIVTVFYLGNPDIGPIVCGYIGSFLMSGSYLAVAAFTSALSKSQVVSFIISVVICLLLVLAGFPPVTGLFAEYSNIIDFVASFSFITHFNNLQRGVLDFRDVVFYLSVTVFFLFMTGLNLKNHNAG
jgi:ABC-2 type transport system permease protein